jgi:hypothetical protein
VPEYVVDVKPSARRLNGAVGTVVNDRGTRHRFGSRDDAEMWAEGLSTRGERRVWIRAANPDDATGADGYLVSRRRREVGEGSPVEGDGEGNEGTEQVRLPDEK